MIKSVKMENFGPIQNIEWNNIGKLNLIIGSNATGKTFLLKAIYTLIRTSEECGKGDDRRKFEQVLADKLYWTFQAEKFNDLITKGANGRLKMQLSADNGTCEYSIGEKTTNTITDCTVNFSKREDNSVFLPAKEVLSLFKLIINSREQMKSFGFDDTYYDLAKALNIPTQKGRNYKLFSDARENLEKIINGRIEFDSDSGRWFMKKGRNSFSIHTTSEGTKKIAILDNLLGNRYLTPGSIMFIDEPESALHPKALINFLDIVSNLVKQGIQVFMATHSYFTIKKLYLIAKTKNIDIPVISLTEDGLEINDLSDGMPKNSIVDESVRLYEEEVRIALL